MRGVLMQISALIILLIGKDGQVLTGIRLQPLELLMVDTPSLLPRVLIQIPVEGSK
jgi:hypothetical protein